MSIEPTAVAELARESIRGRAATGAVLVGARTLAIRLMGLVGSVVLARFLTPADFGAVAVGLALTSSALFMSDAGLGAGFIRAEQEPSRIQLETVLGLQLVVSILLVVVAAAIALPLGRVGAITTLMLGSLPFLAFRTPAVIWLERRLDYRAIARGEVAGSLAFQVWAIATVVMGFGVWGYATAPLARAAVEPILLIVAVPLRVLRPRFSVKTIREALSFGVRVQAVQAVNAVRDQALNLTLASLGGLTTLGLWSLAYRILQVPYMLFYSLWRVAFPAMARLIEQGQQVRKMIETLAGTTALLTGALLAPLVACVSALVPFVFGVRWEAAADVIPLACLALQLGGPTSVAVAGFLVASGDASTVLRAAVAHTVALVGVAAALVPVLGLSAVGVAFVCSSLVDLTILGRRGVAQSGASLWRPIGGPFVLATLATLAGLAAAAALHDAPGSILVSAPVALGSYMALVRAFSPRLLKRTINMTTDAVRQMRSRRTPGVL